MRTSQRGSLPSNSASGSGAPTAMRGPIARRLRNHGQARAGRRAAAPDSERRRDAGAEAAHVVAPPAHGGAHDLGAVIRELVDDLGWRSRIRGEPAPDHEIAVAHDRVRYRRPDLDREWFGSKDELERIDELGWRRSTMEALDVRRGHGARGHGARGHGARGHGARDPGHDRDDRGRRGVENERLTADACIDRPPRHSTASSNS